MANFHLTEYQPLTIPAGELPESIGTYLWQHFGERIEVEFPSARNQQLWRLTSRGWVGYLPLPEAYGLWLQSRVPIANLFRMLEYAYDLKSFALLEGDYACDSLQDIYERLAGILAGRVLARARQGYHRAYVAREEELAFVRGRLDVPVALRRPWRSQLPCQFQEHTPDIDDNRLLAWTLAVILRHGITTARTEASVKRAFQSLRGAVTLHPFTASDCVGRRYDRLNQDYGLLHGLCRYFLEQAGPSHDVGDRAMAPFMVSMPQLYEQFVAEWLKSWVPKGYEVMSQVKFSIDSTAGVEFIIDLVLYHRGQPVIVLDTKYKTPGRAGTSDIAQVVAYAEAMGCNQAVLVYPQALSAPLDGRVGDVRVSSMTFCVEGDLEQGGQRFLEAVLSMNTAFCVSGTSVIRQ